MRDLTAKQKHLLKQQVDVNDVSGIDDIDYDEFVAIEKINETEVFYQNANRFIHDYRWSKINV